jgi:hypothetical protein
MSDWRKILDRKELAAIHSRGEGFVLYPFGKVLHAARCPTVQRMSLNPREPKWFAPDAEAAKEYQRARLAAHARAQPLKRASCCVVLVDSDVVVTRGGTVPAVPAAPSAPQPAKAQDSDGAFWIAQGPAPEDSTVQLWTTRRTPFTTDQSPEQKAMVRALEARLRQLQCEADDRLHGTFDSDEVASRQPDAENITFYNFGARPFVGAHRSLGFERSYHAGPPPPVELPAPVRYHHSWEVVPNSSPYRHWVEGDLVASWSDMPIDLGGDLGLAAWRAMRERADLVHVRDRLSAHEYFGVQVVLAAPAERLPSIVSAVKGLVDGPLAGLQRADVLPRIVIDKLLGRRWAQPIDEASLLRLVSAEHPGPVLPRAPFNKNGLDPCDELCVAGIARLEARDGRPTVSGQVIRLAARDGATSDMKGGPRP